MVCYLVVRTLVKVLILEALVVLLVLDQLGAFSGPQTVESLESELMTLVKNGLKLLVPHCCMVVEEDVDSYLDLLLGCYCWLLGY